MQPPGQSLRLVGSFHREGDPGTINIDHAGTAADDGAGQGRGEMLQINMRADALFTFFQVGDQQFECGMFDLPDQPWRRKDRRETFEGDRLRAFNRERCLVLGSDAESVHFQ